MPVFSDDENILLEYGITASAYHSGKLNGDDYCELLNLGKIILSASKAAYSLSHIPVGVAMT